MASQLRNVITNLSELSVTGVTNNYDIDDTPGSLHTVQLPALIIFIGGEFGTNLNFGAFNGSAASVSYVLHHILFIEAIAQTRGLKDINPQIAILIDNYVNAISANPFLKGSTGKNSHNAITMSIKEPNVQEFPADSKQQFVAIDFEIIVRFNL